MSERTLFPITADRLDVDALKVVRRLTQFHYEAYFVGGCVRDLLVGGMPKDFDVATSATPNEIRRIFRNARIIGRRFRLAHLLFGRKVIETATFRRNPREAEAEVGAEADGEAEVESEDLEASPAEAGEIAESIDPEELTESPEAVEPEDLLIRQDNVFGTAEEDARRRDFTINGLFYDAMNNRIIDYVEGLPDLRAGLVRTIGDPQVRMREDPVRILRAIRFAARLGFTIDPQTWQAMLDHRAEISRCAPPRILEDLCRLLRRGTARPSLDLMSEAGMTRVLLPELARVHDSIPAAIRAHQCALERLDEMSTSSSIPSNALLMGALLLPLVEPLTRPDQPLPSGDPVLVVDAVVRPIAMRMRLPRRDVDRIRKMVLASRRMLGRRGRRFRPLAFARREEFAESLALLEMLAAGWPQGADALRRWREIAQQAYPSGPPPLGYTSPARVRRGRRGRGRPPFLTQRTAEDR